MSSFIVTHHQTLITDYSNVRLVEIESLLSLFCCCGGFSFSSVEDKYFNLLLSSLYPKWKEISRKTLTSEYIPRTANKVRDFVINQLRGQSVCLAVDETERFRKSYYSFLIYPPSKDGVVYFWKIVQSKAKKAVEVAKLIADEINELSTHSIKVISYATDNCNVMKSTETLLGQMFDRPIVRVGCGSHVLNGVFKKVLSFKGINTIWKGVIISSFINKM